MTREPIDAVMPMIFSADYVRARWAYSELVSPRQGDKYGADLRELREKSARKVPFDDLAQQEIDLLVSRFNEVRGVYFNRFIGTNGFRLAHWTKDELGPVL